MLESTKTMTAAGTDQANLFDLHNLTVKISYSASGIDGKPSLSYKKGGTTLNFRGSQLRQKQTEIGTLVTVTLKQVPDLKTVVLTLIVPQVNIPDNDNDGVSVAVKAIETTIRTTIAGPNGVRGQVQTYKSLSLRGKAQSVLF
jgi:hypothetical protein